MIGSHPPSGTTLAPARPVITLVVLAVPVAAFAILQSFVIPVLGELQRKYQTDQATISWALTAYLLAASVCTPLLGKLGDVLGRRRVLLMSLSALSVGLLMAALAGSVEWLIAARVIQGVGGGVVPSAFAIVRDEFPPEKVNGGLSGIASVAALGFGIGLVLAAPTVRLWGVSGLFWVPLAVTVGAAMCVRLFIPARPSLGSHRAPPMAGALVSAALLSAWMLALLLGISQANAWGWASWRVVGLLVFAGVVACTWGLAETRSTAPLIDMRTVVARGVWTANVVALFTGFGMFASLAFLPQLLQAPVNTGYGLGASITESGHVLLSYAGTSFLIGFVAAPLMRALATRTVVAGGALLTAGSLVSIALWHATTGELLIALGLLGLGSGLVLASLPAIVVASVPATQTGLANGINANIRTMGGAMGTAVVTAVLNHRLGPSGFPLESGYVAGFAVLAGAMVLAAVAALTLPDVRSWSAYPR